MQKTFELWASARVPVNVGNRTSEKTKMTEKIADLTVDLNEMEVRLLSGISGVGVTAPNPNGTIQVYALVGGMFQLLAFDSPIRPGSFGGMTGGTNLSKLPYTRQNSETNEMEIVRAEGSGKVIQLSRWNAADPTEQLILEAALVKLAMASANYARGLMVPVATPVAETTAPKGAGASKRTTSKK